MSINTLTDKDCREAKNNDGKLKKYFDGHGLFLAVLPTGSKVWRLAYRHEGKEKTASIGPYPLISLKDARVRRDELRVKLLDGIDPTFKEKVKEVKTVSFCIAEYWAGRNDVSPTYKHNAMRGLEMHIEPFLGDKPIKDITREILMETLRPMDAAGKTVYVRKVKRWFGQVIEWAMQHGHCESNPATQINSKSAFGHKKVKGFAFLPVSDVHGFMDRMALEENLQSVIGCKFLALTWVRTDELRSMVWSEIEGDSWRIPGKRMKGGLEHIVPLSKQAQALIAEMKMRSTGSDYVFPSDRRNDRPMSENSILYLMHRIGYKGRMTGHGWRKVGSTWANENEFNADHVEKQLAHVDDTSRGVYNSAEYLKQRRIMLQAYADWLLI
jgi:integrase